jgi:hypothetical protein
MSGVNFGGDPRRRESISTPIEDARLLGHDDEEARQRKMRIGSNVRERLWQKCSAPETYRWRHFGCEPLAEISRQPLGFMRVRS